MLQLYLFRMLLLCFLALLGSTLIGCLYKRTRIFCLLIGLLFLLTLSRKPSQDKVSYLEQYIRIKLYGLKYRGKTLDYARAELGAPYSVTCINGMQVWRYQGLTVICGDSWDVLDIQPPEGDVGSYK